MPDRMSLTERKAHEDLNSEKREKCGGKHPTTWMAKSLLILTQDFFLIIAIRSVSGNLFCLERFLLNKGECRVEGVKVTHFRVQANRYRTKTLFNHPVSLGSIFGDTWLKDADAAVLFRTALFCNSWIDPENAVSATAASELGGGGGSLQFNRFAFL